jgi:ribosomal protein L12E/L44/L45/RPP1/RPP2
MHLEAQLGLDRFLAAYQLLKAAGTAAAAAAAGNPAAAAAGEEEDEAESAAMAERERAAMGPGAEGLFAVLVELVLREDAVY